MHWCCQRVRPPFYTSFATCPHPCFSVLMRWKTSVEYVTSLKSLTPSIEISGGPSCVNSSQTPGSVHFVNYHLRPPHFMRVHVHPLSAPKISLTPFTRTPMLPAVSQIWRVLKWLVPFHHLQPLAKTSTFPMPVPGHHCKMDFLACPISLT